MYASSFAGLSAERFTVLTEAEGGRSDTVQSLIAEARTLLRDGVRAADRACPLAERFLERLLALARLATRPDGLSQAERQGHVDEMQSIVDRLAGRAPPNGPPGNYVDLHALVHGYLHTHLQGLSGRGDGPLHRERGATLLMLQAQLQRLTPDYPRAMRDLAEVFDAAQAGVSERDRKIAEASRSTASVVPARKRRPRLTAEAPPPVPPRTSSRVMVNIQRADNFIDNTKGLVVVNMAGGSRFANAPRRPAPTAEGGGMGNLPQPGARGVGSLSSRGAGRAGAVSVDIKSAANVVVGGSMTVFMGPGTSALRKDGRRIFDQIAHRVGPAPQGEMAERLARAWVLKEMACTLGQLSKGDRQSCVDELRAIRRQVTQRHREMTADAKV